MKTLTIILLVLWPALCVAQGADTTSLTIGRCLDAAAALMALDHYDDPTTGKPRQYKLGAVRMTIGLNMAALRHVSETVDKARLGLIAEVFGGKLPETLALDERAKLTATFNDEYRKVLDQPCDVRPGRIKAADLRLGDGPDENAIPPSVLAALAPILDP